MTRWTEEQLEQAQKRLARRPTGRVERPTIDSTGKVDASVRSNPMDTLPERFWRKVQKFDHGCWVWTASDNGFGYGLFKVGRNMRRVHKLVYEAIHGPVPSGLELDHLCRNRRCCNPAHLEAVTKSVNQKRGLAGLASSRRAAAITHCPSGHEYNEANSYYVKTNRGGRGRKCKQCNRERASRNKKLKKQQREVKIQQQAD